MGTTEILWEADDQAARLVDMTSNAPELKKAPLSRDVRNLGRLLREVVKEQAGIELFDRVEHLRLLAIEHRDLQSEKEPPADSETDPYKLMNQAREFEGQMSDAEAHELTKAFAISFELINLAEPNHRNRRSRAAEFILDREPQAGS